ncbi:hypothetical protein SRABI76_02340 [Microbacterium oxydans]|nr:hypothetical protein SRABI76_02340 [Microbacterium oxydans]
MQTTCRLFMTLRIFRICIKRENIRMTEEVQKNTGISRRAVVKGAAWSVPVIAAAVATPLAAASGVVDVGAFSLAGSCGVLGVLGPGFTITAGATQPLPTGTTITITGSGVANIGVFSITGGTANVNVLSATSRQITLTAPLAAGATLAVRTTLSISVAFTLNAAATLPTGFSGTGAKTSGSVNSTLILCSAT